jgi:hypothetical protein
MSEDDELAQIIAKSDHPHAAAERVFQLFGKRFIVEKDDDRPESFDPDADEDDEDNEAKDETPTERRARLRRARRMAEASRETARLASTRKALTVDDLTAIADTLYKSADAKTISKLAATEVDRGASLFTSYERSVMVTAIAKAQDRGGGPDDRVFSKFLQSPENLLYRQWALLQPDVAEISKRDTLLDDVAKVSSPGAAPALGGRTAFAVGRGSAGSKATEADKEREAAIEQQMRLGRWRTVEEAARYIDGLEAELHRMAENKQRRARPGTLERVV